MSNTNECNVDGGGPGNGSGDGFTTHNTKNAVTIEQLRSEIERLTRELDQASSEKIQSAQYGLVLLEEKSHLQQKCDEFESLYDTVKLELDITQKVIYIINYCSYSII